MKASWSKRELGAGENAEPSISALGAMESGANGKAY